jgi:hypothetical protein
LAQAVVLEGAEDDEIAFSTVEIPYEWTRKVGIYFPDGKLGVVFDQAHSIMRFDPVENCELYVYVENMDKMEVMDNEGYAFWFDGMDGDNFLSSVANYGQSFTRNVHLYGGKHTWLYDLGRYGGRVDGVYMRVRNQGFYPFDEIKILAKKKEDALDLISGLQHDAENVSYEGNKLKADIHLEEDGYVFVAVPYAAGWKCFDNGKEIEILQADEAFMALDLAAGDHQITMRYSNPLFFAGCFSSLAMAGVWFLIYRKRGSL